MQSARCIFRPLVRVSLLVLLLETLMLPIPSKARRNNLTYQVDHNLLMLQCKMKFCSNGMDVKADHCNHRNCHQLLVHYVRHGSCPASSAVGHPNATSHLDTDDLIRAQHRSPSVSSMRRRLITMAAQQHCRSLCTTDSGCPAAQKCCTVGCARVCQPAHGLATVSLAVLPDVPLDLEVTQWPQQQLSAIVSMTMASSDVDRRLMLETRTHAGYVFRERKLGQWHEQPYVLFSHQLDGGRSVISVEVNKLRPGRWYQFRAAAMGTQGTRGYSQPTAEFQLRDSESLLRDPHVPRNFTVDVAPRQQRHNGSVYARVTWRPPRSDFPVEKYRLTWELSYAGDAAASVGPITQRDAIIQEPMRFYEFWDLKPNAIYNLSLQALTSFGRRRMKSPLETLTINTKLSSAHQQQHQRKRNGSAPKIAVHLVSPTRRSPLVARVQWTDHYAGSPVICDQIAATTTGSDDATSTADAVTVTHESKTVRAAQRHVDFAGLRYDRRYAVRLLNAATRTWDVHEFRTPTCVEHRQKYPRMRCGKMAD